MEMFFFNRKTKRVHWSEEEIGELSELFHHFKELEIGKQNFGTCQLCRFLKNAQNEKCNKMPMSYLIFGKCKDSLSLFLFSCLDFIQATLYDFAFNLHMFVWQTRWTEFCRKSRTRREPVVRCATNWSTLVWWKVWLTWSVQKVRELL